MKILFTPALILACLHIAMLIYHPLDLHSVATEDFHVSTTSQTDNYFVSPDSGFVGDDYILHNCTLFKRFDIGVVKQDNNGNTDGFDILVDVFNDMATGYSLAHENQTLSLKVFDNHEELQTYVEKFSYMRHPLCYAMGWNEFTMQTNTFSLDLRMNFGDILAPRRPQTEYEESTQN